MPQGGLQGRINEGVPAFVGQAGVKKPRALVEIRLGYSPRRALADQTPDTKQVPLVQLAGASECYVLIYALRDRFVSKNMTFVELPFPGFRESESQSFVSRVRADFNPSPPNGNAGIPDLVAVSFSRGNGPD